VLGDLGIYQLTKMRFETRVGAFFVLTHQPRIAGDIDRQNGRQSSLDPQLAHLASQSPGRFCG